MTEGRSTEVVRIDALVCGPDFQELMSEPRVLAIADRVAINGGSSTLPIVRASDMNVIAGEDIVAAHCLLDIDELTVELVHDGSLDDEPATEFSPHGETQCARTEVTPVPLLQEYDGSDPYDPRRLAPFRTEATPAPTELYRPVVPAVNETFSNVPVPTEAFLQRARSGRGIGAPGRRG